MTIRPSVCASMTAVAVSICLLLLSGVVEVSFTLHCSAWMLKGRPAADDHPAKQHVQSLGTALEVLPATRDITRRSLLGHRDLKYSIYTGVDRTARDLNQIERALERLKANEKGVGTQALETMLAHYRIRHAQCLNSSTLPGKYMLMSMTDNYAGLGNQLPGIITGFVLALLTDRCYFIDFPFYHRNFAPDLDFSWEAHAARLAALGHDVTAQPPLELQFWKGQDLNAWLMHDQKALYGEHYGIHLKNDPDYSAALLQANAFHAPLLRQLFPSGEMFQPLSRFLLKVKPELESQVQDFKQKNFRPVTIGLQIRRLKCDGHPGSIHCDQLPEVENFVAVAKALQRARGLDDSEVRFFVGADEPESYVKVVQLLGKDRAIFRHDNGVGSVKSQVIGVYNPGTPESALIDMRLLSECSELVVTVGSSYGSVAAAWGGIVPVQMLHGEHKNVQNPYWYRALTSEPCYWKGNIFLNSEDPFWGTLGAEEKSQFKSNPFWMQYSQCHCAS